MNKILIVGLGNIGENYKNTRHNIGFKIINHFVKKEGVVFKTKKLADVASLRLKGRDLTLIKPNTYMNLSGKAVKYWINKENIPLENMLVITDDLNLPFGTIRIKTKGSDGGHNGLKDLQAKLQTTNYNRFRFGIGDIFNKGHQVDYVLGKWTEAESFELADRLQVTVEVIKSFALAGVSNTMNLFNGK